MRASDKEMAPRELQLPGTRPTEKGWLAVDTNILRKDYPESSTPAEETPHACLGGWVYLGFEGEDENGECVELVERVPCRRCNRESL
jgi:hypothetical protein